MEVKLNGKTEKEVNDEKLVAQITEEFKRRQKERLALERQWELNVNFLKGNQYCDVSSRGEIVEEDKEFFWQSRGVFNHIAPIMETRAAKLARVTPTVYVRPATDDDEDVKSAQTAEKLISETFKTTAFEEKVKEVTSWSEACGTGFYKIVWNGGGGNTVGKLGEEEVREGDVGVIAVSPFEIFPDNLYAEDFDKCSSVMQVKALPVSYVKEVYGVNLVGGNVDVFDLTAVGKTDLKKKRVITDSVIVIEDYRAPSAEYPNGRLITVAGDKVLYEGELPYAVGERGQRGFPFVKQQQSLTTGCFFGSSVVERLIPVQRAYNAVKNRKHEFLNRLTNGVLTVEDGSVDVDELAEEGLSPGKILVYRQGGKAPETMNSGSVPAEFADEEEKLINEFVIVSGVSDVSSSSKNAKLSSGSALEILIEQDNERLTASAEIIRKCYLKAAKMVLRLFKQFSTGVKAVKGIDGFGRERVYYADKSAYLSDDVYLESENELLYTARQKKNVVFQLYESGLLFNENGKLDAAIKEKVLSLLGYKDLDSQKGLARLQEEKAAKENEKIRKGKKVVCEEIDDHDIHVNEHKKYVLSEYDELTDSERARFSEHIAEHKRIKQQEENIKTEEN